MFREHSCILLLLAFLVSGCVHTEFNLKETDPQGNTLNTYQASFDSEKSMREAVSRYFSRKNYAQAIRWGNVYLDHRVQHWQGKSKPNQVADISMMVSLAHLYMVRQPSDLETIFFNNGHIKASMNFLQNHKLKSADQEHCSVELHRILDRGAYNETALFAFIQGMRNSTSLIDQTPVITIENDMFRTLKALKREYPKWYEDMEIDSWQKCLTAE